MKTLKYEEVYRSEYRDLAEAHAAIGEFLEKVYNFCPNRQRELTTLTSKPSWNRDQRRIAN